MVAIEIQKPLLQCWTLSHIPVVPETLSKD